MFHKRSFAISLFICTMLLFTSCCTYKASVLSPDSEWFPYEQKIDAAVDSEQTYAAYTDFYKKLIADDGTIGENEWKNYCAATNLLERKLNQKGRKYCGHTFFDIVIGDKGYDEDKEEREDSMEDFDFEDNFDYNEFDSSM